MPTSQSIARKLIQFRWLLSALLIVACASLTSSLAGLGFATDYRIFFDKADPLLKTWESIEREFTESNTLVFIVNTPSGDLITAPRLAALNELTASAWRLPDIARVNSPSNFQHTSAIGDDMVVEDLLFEAADYDSAQLERVRRIILAEPELRGLLISDSLNVATVVVYVALEAEQYAEKKQLILKARALAEEFVSKHPDFKVQLSGQLAVDHGIAEVAERDSVNLESLMFLTLLLLLAVLFRSLVALLASFAVMLISVLATVGFLGQTYDSFNGINLSAPYMVLNLAILDAVHVISSYFTRLSAGDDKTTAMTTAIAKNLEALVLTTITTAVGFLATNLSSSPPFREFGNATVFGICFALLATLSLLPAIMLLFPAPKQRKPPLQKAVAVMHRTFQKIQGKVLPVGLVLAALAAGLSFTNVVDSRMLEAFRPAEPVRQAAEFLDENLSGYTTLEFVLDSGSANGIGEPAFMASAAEFAAWLREQEQVRHVVTFSDTVKRLNKSLHGDRPEAYRLPDTRAAIAQQILLYESNVPEELNLQDSISADKRSIRQIAYFSSLSTQELTHFYQRALTKLEHMDAFHEVKAASPSLMFAYVGITNVERSISGFAWVALFVCIAMVIAFRSLKLGIVCMLPNLMPAAFAFALCALWRGEIDLGASLVLCMSLGIVVDDTLHFVISYRRARAEGYSQQAAVEESYNLVGRAILITSIILCVGFAIPALFASLALNSLLYTLMIVVIFSAMLIDLFFLPALLMKIERN